MTSRSVPLALVLAGLACTESGPDAPEVPTDVEYCSDAVDWTRERSDFEREVLERINLYREIGATCGPTVFEPAEPLTMDLSLRCAARVHALDMIEHDYVMHSTPEGWGFADRAGFAEYDATPVGEVIATGLLSPEDVVSTWMSRENECTNLMNPNADDVGVGYLATDDATFGTYWVAVFGER